MYNVKELTQLASKYLDRVEVKGLQEFHEFGFLVNFFAEVEQGNVELTKVEKPITNEGK